MGCSGLGHARAMKHPGETLKSQASPGGTGGCQYLTYVKRKGQLGLVKWIFHDFSSYKIQ